MNRNYNLTVEDNDMIDHVAEKIYQNADSFKGKTISWEDFTVNYMNMELPEDTLTEVYWVRYRPTWVYAINDAFIKMEYQVTLDVEPGRGVKVYSGYSAITNSISTRVRKLANVLDKYKEVALSLEHFTDQRKNLRIHAKIAESILYETLGRISSSRLPAKERSELKMLLQYYLPDEE